MAVSFSAAAVSPAGVLATVLAAGFAAKGLAETFPAETLPEGEAAGPLADRLASPAPDRRFGGEAVAPVAARVGVGTALPTGAFFDAVAVFAACVAPEAASDAFVLLVVTAVILAL